MVGSNAMSQRRSAHALHDSIDNHLSKRRSSWGRRPDVIDETDGRYNVPDRDVDDQCPHCSVAKQKIIEEMQMDFLIT